tara:strand:- start:245 stop:667 length:423 start_codon:yes stop_codon:yes gene_type:complete
MPAVFWYNGLMSMRLLCIIFFISLGAGAALYLSMAPEQQDGIARFVYMAPLVTVWLLGLSLAFFCAVAAWLLHWYGGYSLPRTLGWVGYTSSVISIFCNGSLWIHGKHLEWLALATAALMMCALVNVYYIFASASRTSHL